VAETLIERADALGERLLPRLGLIQAVVWVLVAVSVLSFLVQGVDTTPRPHVTNTYLPGTAPAHP
jgi:hypothetical protein